jgi:two-component system LytT family response regulator
MTRHASPLRVLIVDDESPARRLLKRLLQNDSDLDLIGECSNGIDAARTIVASKPDLVFLDIQMPGLDGFDVLAEVGSSRLPAIIFVTAYDRYAVKAFETHALDYLLKPFSRKRFYDAVDRAKQLLRRSDRPQRTRLQRLLRDWQRHESTATRVTPGDTLLHRILVKSKGEIIRLELEDIYWLESADHFVVAHTASGKHLLSEALTELEKSLPLDRFIRIHRRAIVNRRHIQRISPGRFGSCSVQLTTGVRLRLSRSRRETLKDLLNR